MEQKTKNYLKLGMLLFGVYLLSIKCQPDMTFDANKKIDAKTVSFEQAKAFFKEKQTKVQYLKNSNNLTLQPDWNTLSQEELAYTDALLTKVETDVNRTGDFSSNIIFINIDNEIKSVIVTSWSTQYDNNNNLLNGYVFINDYDGTFIDAYKIEDGLFTAKLIPNLENYQQASMFSIFSLAIGFQTGTTTLQPADCWNTDNLPTDGDLGAVELGTIVGGGSSGNGDRTYTDGTAQAPNGVSSSDNYGVYLNGAIPGFIGSSGNHTGVSKGSINRVVTASLLNPINGEILAADIIERRKECLKINKLLFDYQIDTSTSISQMLTTLKATTNQNHENSVSVFKDNTNGATVGEDCKGEVDPATNTTSKYVLFAHTHDACGLNGSGTFSVFSMGDLKELAKFCYSNKLDNGTFVAFLATNDNTQYALTISQPNLLINLFYYDIVNDNQISNFDFLKYTQSKGISEKLNYKYFDPSNPNAKLKVDSTEPNTDLLEFLNFMEEANMGIKLFESNATFDDFKDVVKEQDTINKIRCI